MSIPISPRGQTGRTRFFAISCGRPSSRAASTRWSCVPRSFWKSPRAREPMEQYRSPSGPSGQLPTRGEEHELALGLVHATEAAALTCAGFLGKGDPDRVSEAAGDALRPALQRSCPSGTVVLSPRHYAPPPHGAVIGSGDRKVDLGGHPVEGASQTARGHINAVSLLVAVEPGGFARLPAVSRVEQI